MSAPSDLISTAAPAGQSTADRVLAQLGGDYPPAALSWVRGLTWTGPVQVPTSQLDRSATSPEWAAAAADKTKLAQFKQRINGGFRKPVILVRTPGKRLLYVVDGHTRATACQALGIPVTAFIGTAATATGGWVGFHSKQLAGDRVTAELSNGAGYPAGVVKAKSGMISLDLPPGTIKPLPGGVTDHHITVVFLGDNVNDQAFAAACQRAKAAAAAAPGPLRGVVGGIGSFQPSSSSDGKRPAFAKAHLPDAQPIRRQLEDLSASEHPGWKPHVTLAYVGKNDPLPASVPATPVTFTHLSVHRGKDVRRFALGSGKEQA